MQQGSPGTPVQLHSFLVEFAEICKARSELHFPDIETQLLDIRTQYRKACAERQTSLPRGTRSPSDDDIRLSAGDVYITRHSNLGRAHVVFHLVAGSDEEDLVAKELNSRHQVGTSAPDYTEHRWLRGKQS